MENIEGILIRSYEDKDYESLRELLQAENSFYQEFDSPDTFKAKINRNPGSIIVAEINNTLVGNVFLIEDGWASYITRLVVDKEHRGRGIGTLLMSEAENQLREKRYKGVTIFVDTDNLDAVDLHKSSDYVIRRPTQYCMFKEL